MSTVFIAFQTNDDTRPIIESILADNPHAVLDEQPAMVKINAEGHLVVNPAKEFPQDKWTDKGCFVEIP